jgi:NADH:ubiquinone oxidoreductase subunit 6 (subunit J)
MEEMSTLEMVLVGAIVVLVLFWVGPGIKPMLEQSRQAENPDWAGLLVPIIAVILFVILLVSMV